MLSIFFSAFSSFFFVALRVRPLWRFWIRMINHFFRQNFILARSSFRFFNFVKKTFTSDQWKRRYLFFSVKKWIHTIEHVWRNCILNNHCFSFSALSQKIIFICYFSKFWNFDVLTNFSLPDKSSFSFPCLSHLSPEKLKQKYYNTEN